MNILKTKDKRFKKRLSNIINRNLLIDKGIESDVHSIIEDVRRRGDRAVFEYTRIFDKVSIDSRNYKIDKNRIKDAYNKVKRDVVSALKYSARRIKAFHKRQKIGTWRYREDSGVVLGQLVQPMKRIGIYVPGGKAIYPSSVLMNAIPAQVAGVSEIIMCTPAYMGEISPYILVAADIIGICDIYQAGGVQAVAAMAFGTEMIPKVDKIVGPGNIYVATAKRLVFGNVDIDMVAGPSEILIIADETARPEFIASDLLSQAEHDEMATAILITTSEDIARSVKEEVYMQVEMLDKREIALSSLKANGTIFVVDNISDAIDIANDIAPEHLELAIDKPFNLLNKVKNAGAVFLGHYTPEATGDYIAGPNHVLPTGGTARFSSPLSVDDFVKKTSIISYNKSELLRVRDKIDRIATIEGLDAHAISVRIRV
ncbi:MAG: histidinol dehydrogenase [Nitrospirota bacterium]